MGAFDNTSLDSLWVFLLGIIFLILTSLGLSLLSDGLIGLGTEDVNTKAIKRTLVDIRIKKEELNKKINRLHAEHKTRNTERQQPTPSAVSVEGLKKNLLETSDELIQLRKSIATEKASLTRLEEQFANLRDQTRALLWISGRGRPLKKIPHPKGGLYEEARITKIDKDGIFFRHQAGAAHLQLPQIPDLLIEEFDLRP